MEIIDFDSKYLKEAALLLQNAQVNQFQSIGCSYFVSQELCEQKILSELKKEVSSSHLLMFEKKVVGYAISTIQRDPIWGDSGRVELSGWCIKPEYIRFFPYLYQKIADAWIGKNIYRHYFLAFDADKSALDVLYSMGFAGQQTHALLELRSSYDFIETSGSLVYRRSNADDQIEMSRLSRLIAEYQSLSPCFATAPAEYLDALDEGFSDITTDPEVDLFVIQDGLKLAGYQAYYDTEIPGLIIPTQTVELAVSAVRPEYRGRGYGLNLTFMGLAAQKKRGFKFAVADWRCANLLSSSFWIKIGFIPVAHRLVRVVDKQPLCL